MDRGWPQCQKCAITFPTKKFLHEHNAKLHYGSKPKRDNKNKQGQFQEKERPGERQFKIRLSPKYHDPVVQQIQYRIAKEREENGHFKCTMCGANFKRKPELNIHVTSVHGGTAIY